jgi:predicted nicotinamide N-methyase
LRLKYQTFEFGTTDIHVRTMRDRQQYADDEGIAEQLGISPASWPLFGVVWPSGELLAQLMYDYDIEGKRILEVGCGMGLPSLVLNHRGADITATDYHPEADGFLRKNARLNDDPDIVFVRTGWGEGITALGKFDLIIGSDLLYEPDQAYLLSAFIDQHASAECEVIIVDPGRGLYPRFCINMLKAGFQYIKQKPEGVDHLNNPFRGQVLTYQR